jgi:hypothetical protein
MYIDGVLLIEYHCYSMSFERRYIMQAFFGFIPYRKLHIITPLYVSAIYAKLDSVIAPFDMFTSRKNEGREYYGEVNKLKQTFWFERIPDSIWMRRLPVSVVFGMIKATLSSTVISIVIRPPIFWIVFMILFVLANIVLIITSIVGRVHDYRGPFFVFIFLIIPYLHMLYHVWVAKKFVI